MLSSAPDKSHGRRKFVEIAEAFPDETRYVLETLREVYKTDAKAKQENLTPAERLALHQRESGPRMAALEAWMTAQVEERKVEPNSALGRAMRYMHRRWSRLTLFLRLENVPLDNNLCERVLKKAIRHRRNSLYYRTSNGARIGDIWMSLIHTAEMNGVPAFEYLVALLRHPNELKAHPAEWMPWTFRATLARMKAQAEGAVLSPDGGSVRDFPVEAHPISRVGDHLMRSLAEQKWAILTRRVSCWQVSGP